MLHGKEEPAMNRLVDSASSRRRQRMQVAACWLGVGAALLVLTPLPAHTAALGWGPALWLVVAPLVLLFALEPRLPLRVLAMQRQGVPRRLRSMRRRNSCMIRR
jgi:hypothetical protein